MNRFPLQDFLEELVEFFDSNSIDYMLMGGLAVRFWAIPRPTFDLDFTLALDPSDVPSCCEALRNRGYTIPEIHERGFLDELAGMKKFGVIHHEDGREVKVDMFLVTTEYQRCAYGRRVRKKLNGKSGWLIAPEDLILHKLISQRERDLGDVTDILWINNNLDIPYMRKWAVDLKVDTLLNRKLAEDN